MRKMLVNLLLMSEMTWGLSRRMDGNDLINDNVLITRHQMIVVDMRTPLNKKGSIRTLQNAICIFLTVFCISAIVSPPFPIMAPAAILECMRWKKRAFVLLICESKDLGSKCDQLESSCCGSTLDNTYLGISSLRCRLLDRSITTSGPTICQRHFQSCLFFLPFLNVIYIAALLDWEANL